MNADLRPAYRNGPDIAGIMHSRRLNHRRSVQGPEPVWTASRRPLRRRRRHDWRAERPPPKVTCASDQGLSPSSSGYAQITRTDRASYTKAHAGAARPSLSCAARPGRSGVAFRYRRQSVSLTLQRPLRGNPATRCRKGSCLPSPGGPRAVAAGPSTTFSRPAGAGAIDRLNSTPGPFRLVKCHLI